MRASECAPTDEVFTHIEDGTGIVRHFNASAMSRAAPTLLRHNKVTLIHAEIDKEFVAFILQRRGVEAYKLARLREPYLSIPTIGVDMGDDTVLVVDGHHRLVVRNSLGEKLYDMYRFPLGQWGQFLVTDIPDSLSFSLADATFNEQGKVTEDFLKSISK